jgi:ATP-binding cassette subfamily C (CFTR/MRP) protein 4
MLKYFEGTVDIWYALKYAFLICFSITINCIVHHPFFLYANMTGLKMRVSLAGLVYKKAFRLNTKGLDNNSSGQLMNIISADCSRIESCILFCPYIFIAPIELLIVIGILVNVVHWSMLAGLFIIFLSLPIQSVLGKVFDHLRRTTSAKCDKRINLLNEILNGIKIIKMYCWEEPFKKTVEHLRR